MKAQDVTEHQIAGRLLVIAAKQTSHGADQFITWYATAYTAIVTYILTHTGLDQLHNKWWMLSLVILSSLLIIIQKLIVLCINSTSASIEEVEKHPFPSFNLGTFINIYCNAIPPVIRGIVVRKLRKILNGEWSLVGKLLYKLSIVQGTLALFSLIMSAVAFVLGCLSI